MAVTTKAKSAIYHLKTALSGMEKATVHLIQAKTALPKKDEDNRANIANCSNTLTHFEGVVNATIKEIEKAHPSESEEE